MDNKKKTRHFYKEFKWQLLIVFIPMAVIPLVLVVFIASIRIYAHLEVQSQKYYTNLLTQVATNIDFVYERYAMTMGNLSELDELQETLNAPPYRTKQEEIEISQNLTGRENEDAGKAQLRKILQSRVDAAGYIYEMDRRSLIDNTPYKVHRVNQENFNTFARYDKLMNDPLFSYIQDNDNVKMVIGKLQEGTLAGSSSDTPVIIYPFQISDKRQKGFDKFILLIMFPGFMQRFYRDITEFQMGTLLILDDLGTPMSINHPNSDDYYDYDPETKKYILGDDDPSDPFEQLTFREYQMLLTDFDVLKHEQVQSVIIQLENEMNENDYYSEGDVDTLESITDSRFRILIDGTSYLLVANYAPSSHIKLLYFHPVAQINKPINKLIMILVVITISIIILITIVSFLLSDTLTRPIKRLTGAVFQLSQGNFTIDDIEINSDNEVGILANGFNFMKKEIGRYTQNLEVIIDDRTRELEDKKKELEESNIMLVDSNRMYREQSEFKSKYLANMSHEIRTPLNSIMGFNQLLLYKNYDPRLDICDINKEIMEIIEAVQETEIRENLTDLYQYCDMFNKQVAGKELDLKYTYFAGLQVLVNTIGSKKSKSEPVTAIKKLFNEIKQLHSEEDAHILKNLTTVRKSGKYLLNLINSILDIAKIEAGKVDLVIKEVRIKGYISELIDEGHSYMKNKDKERVIKLSSFIEAGTPAIIKIDKFKIKEVLLNLLSNAIKFTEKGSVDLVVKKVDQNILFLVFDSGVGIKKEDISKLFNEFYRTNTTLMIEGTGLGLALSRKIVELHQGTIDVTSEFGKGSCFTVTLPLIISGEHSKLIK